MKFLAYIRVELEIDTVLSFRPEDIAQRLGVVATFNVPGMKMKQADVPGMKMKQAGYTISVHPVEEKIDGI